MKQRRVNETLDDIAEESVVLVNRVLQQWHQDICSRNTCAAHATAQSSHVRGCVCVHACAYVCVRACACACAFGAEKPSLGLGTAVIVAVFQLLVWQPQAHSPCSFLWCQLAFVISVKQLLKRTRAEVQEKAKQRKERKQGTGRGLELSITQCYWK